MKANETTEAIRVAKKNSPLEVSSRIISGIFTPFMIPFVAFFPTFFLHLSSYHAHPVQTDSIGHSLLFHHSDANARHLPISKINVGGFMNWDTAKNVSYHTR